MLIRIGDCVINLALAESFSYRKTESGVPGLEIKFSGSILNFYTEEAAALWYWLVTKEDDMAHIPVTEPTPSESAVSENDRQKPLRYDLDALLKRSATLIVSCYGLGECIDLSSTSRDIANCAAEQINCLDAEVHRLRGLIADLA